MSQHRAAPFGAVASVHNWERVGAVLSHIAKHFLKMGILRYVDDFFFAERRVLYTSYGTFATIISTRQDTMEHAKQCFVRLLRLLLGESAVADNKVECGIKVVVLGVEITAAAEGIRFRPSPDKARKWSKTIADALESKCLWPGEASKLAGRLSWASSKVFKRFGRALLRPLFDQQGAPSGAIDPDLEKALLWWVALLSTDLTQCQPWTKRKAQPLHLFCDASASPPYLGAVLFKGSTCLWTHSEVPDIVMSKFKRRRDNQIMALELLAIALATCTFSKELQGKQVVIHCDNTGSEVW